RRDDLVTGVQTCALPIWVGLQRVEPVERGQPAPVLRGGIGELSAPERRRLAGGDRLVERRPGCRPPGGTELSAEPCAEGQLIGRSEERPVGKALGYGRSV